MIASKKAVMIENVLIIGCIVQLLLLGELALCISGLLPWFAVASALLHFYFSRILITFNNSIIWPDSGPLAEHSSNLETLNGESVRLGLARRPKENRKAALFGTPVLAQRTAVEWSLKTLSFALSSSE